MNGRVNCSTAIYEDEKRWKKSRSQVDLLIQALKNKIGELKDIRQHLKENKPKNMTDELDFDSNDSSSEEKRFNNSSLNFDDGARSSKRPNAKKLTHRANKYGSLATTTDDQSLDGSSKNYSLNLSPTSVAPNLKSALLNNTNSVNPRNISVKEEHSKKHHQSHRGNDHFRNKSTTTKLPKHNVPMSTRTSKSKPKITELTTESTTSQRSTHTIKSIDEDSVSITSTSPGSTYSSDSESDHTMSTLQQHDFETTPDTPRTECFCEPDTHEE